MGAALMRDGYELYNGIAHDHPLAHLGCRAYSRRAFVKAEDGAQAARTPDLLATRYPSDRQAVRRRGTQYKMGSRSSAAVTSPL
nr:transposase [Burkholderia ubonensis]